MSAETMMTSIAQTAQKAGVSTAMAGGIWAFFAQNAQAIGAACAIAGLGIAFLSFLVNWAYRHLEYRRRAY